MAGVEGSGSRICKVAGSGRYRENSATFCNRKSAKRWYPTKIGRELRLEAGMLNQTSICNGHLVVVFTLLF